MIRNVANLLRDLQQSETSIINKSGISHAPTIGAQFEGLTTELLHQMVIPASIDLQVVSGFVEGPNGALSGQVDCMLVQGQGLAIPHTSLFKWPVRDVIAVFEVKKTLFGEELKEADALLNTVLDQVQSYAYQTFSDGGLNLEPARYAYGQIVGEPAPTLSDSEKMPPDKYMLFRTLVAEQLAPVRVVFGYFGFKDEFQLRKGFTNFLGKEDLELQFAGSSLPTLVICGSSSVIKLNGHPYNCPLNGNEWLWFASSAENPLVLLLELIWTKLSYTHTMPLWFDQDLANEAFSPLISVRAVKLGSDEWGWSGTIYEVAKKDLVKKYLPPQWEPMELTSGQFAVLEAIDSHGSLSRKALAIIVAKKVVTASEVQALQDNRLIGWDGDSLRYLTRTCMTVFTNWGKAYAADNSSGRLNAWVNLQTKLRNRETE